VITVFKSLLTRAAMAAVLTGFLALGNSPAEAKTNVHIWIGIPGFQYWNGPGHYGRIYRSRLNCGEGRWIVDHRGYNSVRATDCSPRYYHYRARRDGRWYIVRFDSRTGHIVRVRRA
jgi:hypothetical protein